MAEWKTDTEEVKKVVDECREFKKTLQEEKCLQFITNLDSYALKVLVERNKIEHRLQDAINGLREAKKKKKSFWRSLLGGVRDVFKGVSKVFLPAELGVAACDEVLNLMEENTEKWKKCKITRTSA